MAGLTLFYFDYSLLSLSHFSSLVSWLYNSGTLLVASTLWSHKLTCYTSVTRVLSWTCISPSLRSRNLPFFSCFLTLLSSDSMTLIFHISSFHAASFSAVLSYICHQSPFTASLHSSTILSLLTSHYNVTNLTLH